MVCNNIITGSRWSNNTLLCPDCPSNGRDSCQFSPGCTSTKTGVAVESVVVVVVDNVEDYCVVVVVTKRAKRKVDLVRVHRRRRRRRHRLHRIRYCYHFRYCCWHNCYCYWCGRKVHKGWGLWTRTLWTVSICFRDPCRGKRPAVGSRWYRTSSDTCRTRFPARRFSEHKRVMKQARR